MEMDKRMQGKEFSEEAVFTLDIGTRSIIGLVGFVENDKIKVVAIERAEHLKRAMVDGQIEDIEAVAKLAHTVKSRLEERLGITLTKVCVAAAGRALRTERASFELILDEDKAINEETIRRLEAGAIEQAEKPFTHKEDEEGQRQFYLVGYSVVQYYLDNYPISSLMDHRGRQLKADIIATFLPSEVVESLYTTMYKAGLEVVSLTLEPIAAINAAIPQELRLLNLALVDIGAGTSDIAVCKDGYIVGYTMATVAGDEVTEALMKEYLIDFDTAEKIKFSISDKKNIQFTDVLGFEQSITSEEVYEVIAGTSKHLCKEISEKILEVNGGTPSAVFLSGGGSKLAGLAAGITEYLHMDPKRVAIAGNNFKMNAVSEGYDLNNPEYATPLGIAISSGLNLIHDSFHITLNGKRAKLFRSGILSILDILTMNGYRYKDLFGHSGASLAVTVNGKRKVFYGEHAVPAILQLNGKEANISDLVNAGDSILFTPAKNGMPARATVADVAECGSGLIYLNGEQTDTDAWLHTGDMILANESVNNEEDSKEDVMG